MGKEKWKQEDQLESYCSMKVRDDRGVIMVKGYGYILKAEPTGYDVRYESKRAVKDEAWYLRLSKWKEYMPLTEIRKTEGGVA